MVTHRQFRLIWRRIVEQRPQTSDNSGVSDVPLTSQSLRGHSAAPDVSERLTSKLALPVSATAAPWASVILLAVLALAAWFRFADLGYSSLSHAEAWRANDSFAGTPELLRRFPPLQLALLYLWQHGIGRTELLLRLPSALAGIACVAAVFLMVRRHVGLTAAVLAAATTACHPALIHQSRILKVFSLEALVAIAVMWTGLTVYRQRTPRAIGVFAGVGIVGILLTFTGSLVVAAWCAVLVWPCLSRDAEGRRPLTRWHVVACGILAAAALANYVWLAGSAQLQLNASYYFAEVERVWPTSLTLGGIADWFVRSSYGALRYVLGATFIWAPLDWIVCTAELIAALAGFGLLWRRARPFCLVIGIVAIEVVILGLIRKWPFGEIRTMTFLVPFTTVLIGCGMYEMARRLGSTPAVWFMMAAIVFVPAARATKATCTMPTLVEHIRPVLQYVDTHCAPEDSLFVYYAADDAFKFYWSRNDVPTVVQPRSDRGDSATFAKRFDGCMQNNGRAWFIFSHGWGTEEQEWLDILNARYELIDQFENDSASARLFRIRPSH